jgi:hypothetical protein
MTTAIASSPVRNVSTAGQPVAEQRTLRHGARGEDVRAVQQQLVDRGARIAVDGVYGDDTARAVRAFQRTQTGLTVDFHRVERRLRHSSIDQPSQRNSRNFQSVRRLRFETSGPS